jgi:hypothetical protein
VFLVCEFIRDQRPEKSHRSLHIGRSTEECLKLVGTRETGSLSLNRNSSTGGIMFAVESQRNGMVAMREAKPLKLSPQIRTFGHHLPSI